MQFPETFERIGELGRREAILDAMSWVTIKWAMIESACLTLALVHVLVYCRQNNMPFVAIKMGRRQGARRAHI